MSFHTLSERLSALQESNAQVKDLIDRLANLNFQPGSIPLDNEDGNVMTKLTSEIQQTIKEQEEDFELLLEDIYELDGGLPGSELEGQRSGLEEAIKRAMRALNSYESDFRKAQLSARRNIQAAQKQERELLLQAYLEPRSSNASPLPERQQQRTQKNKVLSQEEKELMASSDFTLALRRTHESMASELSRSQFAHDTLKESTAALATLSESYSTLDTMLSSSKNLLGTLMRSQKSDTWYLETAFYILIATIAWLFWRRILYGPTWWLVWFPMKMFIKGWMRVFATISSSIGGSGSEVSSVAASVTAATSVVATSVVHRKATRGPRIPNLKPPVMTVGGGGRGAPMRGPNVPGAVWPPREEKVSEQVGKIIDESNDVKVVFKESEEKSDDKVVNEEEQTNPKKRMWEEQAEPPKENVRVKDEL